FKSFLDLFIYSSFLIALGVTLFTLESFIISGEEINTVYLQLIFWSTILIYSLHRIIGVNHIKEDKFAGRFILIRSMTSLLKVIAFISIICLIYVSSRLSRELIYIIIPAGFLSLLYVLPVFGSRRMRDIHFIKIFLIALVWAYCCGIIPVMDTHGNSLSPIGYLLFLEKFIFILAITLPFDVRDLDIDKYENVKTLASLLGINKTYLLSNILLCVGMIILVYILNLAGLGILAITGAVISYGLTFWAVYLSRNKQSDYYFSGLLDAMIILRSAIIILFCFL
ncbi:MAG: UbiA family prenyltransferase, partial [Bacteroidia bacterium]|nr:UbiA family prenyltransferase [Bacteroidia bacterium]